MRDACVQTSDNDASDQEMSAMERDIMLATGCIPNRFRRKLANMQMASAYTGVSSNSVHMLSPKPQAKTHQRRESMGGGATSGENV